MDIKLTKKDDLNATLTIKIEKEDYSDKVEKTLKDYRKNYVQPGFRPGKVPMGLIKKRFGTAVLADEVQKILSESLYKYLIDEKIDVIGSPLDNREVNDKVDFENQEAFEFSFDLGLKPEFELTINKRIKIPYYVVEEDINGEEINNYIDRIRKSYGKNVETEEVSEKSILKGNIVQVNDSGEAVENGISASEVSLLINAIKDDEIKNMFLGKKVGDKIIFDIKKAFDNNITEISAMLNVDKDKIEELNDKFEYEITKIEDFEDAELNKELFDLVFKDENIETEEQFRQKIKEMYDQAYIKDSDYQFYKDVRKKLLDKTEMQLPEDFLKRWILESDKERYDEEKLEKDFPKIIEEFKWELITEKIVKDNDIKITNDELFKRAVELTKEELKQYGISTDMLGDDFVEKYAKERLDKEEERRKLYDMALYYRLVDYFKENFKIDRKKVSQDEFMKILEEK